MGDVLLFPKRAFKIDFKVFKDGEELLGWDLQPTFFSMIFNAYSVEDAKVSFLYYARIPLFTIKILRITEHVCVGEACKVVSKISGGVS